MKDREKELLQRQETGERMRKLRGEKSLNEVATALGVTAMAVSNWERGIRTPSDRAVLRRNSREYFFSLRGTHLADFRERTAKWTKRNLFWALP